MTKPRVVAIVQARMGSTRLPGKVLMDLEGAPMLQRLLERLSRARTVDQIVVATSTKPSDDPIADLVTDLDGVSLFRGSESDVLSRYVGAAEGHDADVIVRITGDCPLVEPAVVDQCVASLLDSADDVGYASNCQRRTYPRGLDVEAFTRASLSTAHRESMTLSDREHVTPFIWSQPDRFAQVHVTDDADHSDLRWTVDTAEDLELVREIYRELHPSNPAFTYEDTLDLIERRPELRGVNRHVIQKPV